MYLSAVRAQECMIGRGSEGDANGLSRNRRYCTIMRINRAMKVVGLMAMGALGAVCPAGEGNPAQSVVRITRDMLRAPPDDVHGELRWSGTIDIKQERTVHASVAVTSKGNGVLEIGGWRAKVFDLHNDCATFQGGMLNVEFRDVNQDGVLDLILLGIVERWGGEKCDVVESREPVLYIVSFAHGTDDPRELVRIGPVELITMER